MPRRGAILGLLLLLLAAQGSVVLGQAIAVAPATIAPPVTLSSLNANTAIGASGTSATTSSAIALPGVGSTNLLKVVHGATAEDVRITVTGRSGFALAPDTVTVALGAATVVVTQSTTLPASTAIVDLDTASDITVTAAGLCIATCGLTMEIRIEPDGAGANPVFVYPYALLVT